MNSPERTGQSTQNITDTQITESSHIVDRPSTTASLVVEAIGTFFLVLTIGCTVLTDQPLAPVAIGSVLMVMIFAGGHISGAHFNPAVTLAVTLRGRLRSNQLPMYWACQIIGGAAGALSAVALTRRHTGNPTVNITTAGIAAEFLFTLALCWVVLNVATSRDHADNHFYGVAIGFTVLAGAVAVGSISGAAFNPAVALGVGIMGLIGWPAVLVWAVTQLAAGGVAAVLFRIANPHDR
ncbi:Aquaporin Z [Austwickia sp. TVS 96-490-7B]|uniref:MIP/aquaporin family protein n=1 Tax=Austwickia sp. TVS 96-490-7B TaxID=2830843 RepID=UPI001C5652A1|nr:aquaporin [Austwickia sp. TVS 96-490-7B]MBW3084849.1 Aquaporin Z [Austwickia sp. TVS 96-490-7B]